MKKPVGLWKCPFCENGEDIYFTKSVYWDDPSDEYRQKCQCPKCEGKWSIIFRATRIEKEK